MTHSQFGVEVLSIEVEALKTVAERLGGGFENAVEMVLRCQGKVVVTGMGKSGAVGRKIAGTLSSTGTPALFLHPSEGIHGDLGVLAPEDLLIALSQSGETDELTAILPSIHRLGVPIIAFTSGSQSTLARYANAVVDTTVKQEACPLNLAPTASTTCMIALGDALALTVMHARRFTREDYARFHPGGSLGRRLLLRTADVMRSGDQLALATRTASVKDVLIAITRASAGAACVVDEAGMLCGLITDGDLRRAFLRGDQVLSETAESVMTHNPVTIGPDALAADGLQLMEAKAASSGAKIGEIPVIDDFGKPVGILMLKDLVRAGIV
ncbi:MAG TPA: KpsF/GutQ family sugar-phosphate isomerase [Armatimonadota bacterium]|jgi:arabinose-5-phosphate isomerase